MKMGVFFTAGEGAVDIADVARAAEGLGFGSLWVGEHVIMPVEYARVYPASATGEAPEFAGLLSSPIVALARAAAVTERLQIGTGVCLLPLHEPIALAKDIATLDRDSGGRFLFGVGGGWLREETEILGGDFDRRWRQISDSVAAMKSLWRDDVAQHEGPYTRFPPVRMNPKPHQRPHPPVLLGGASPRIFDRVAAWGRTTRRCGCRSGVRRSLGSSKISRESGERSTNAEVIERRSRRPCRVEGPSRKTSLRGSRMMQPPKAPLPSSRA